MRIDPGFKRYPPRPKDLLQAWDSADELILDHVNLISQLKDKRLLIINDQFGALSCALQEFDIATYTDSYVSFKGIQLNSNNRVKPINKLNELSGKYEFVLIRIPKNMSFFEDILCKISRHIHAKTKIICGYMVKHTAQAAFELLDKYVGKTTTSLAKKKARLIFAEVEKLPAESPYPLRIEIPSSEMSSFEIPFVNHSNLFSREKLDIGTRFLLNYIPQGNYNKILDLGCANGIIGIAAKKINASASIIFSDESQMAIQSAMDNYSNYFQDQAEYHWTHCYEDQPAKELDLVICNPPFHQGNTVGDFIAVQMFKDAHRSLVGGGQLRVIGNSHLQYQRVLKKLFGKSEIVASNKKFTIMDAIKN